MYICLWNCLSRSFVHGTSPVLVHGRCKTYSHLVKQCGPCELWKGYLFVKGAACFWAQVCIIYLLQLDCGKSYLVII